MAQPRVVERIRDTALHIFDAINLCKEAEVLRRRELGIDVEVVSEKAQPRAQRGPRSQALVRAVPHLAAGRRKERGDDGEERGLAGAVRPQKRNRLAGAGVQ